MKKHLYAFAICNLPFYSMSPPTVTVTKTIDLPPEEVYRIAYDVERYTEFVPGVRRTAFFEDVDGQKIVELELRRGLFSVHLRSLVILEEGRSIRIEEPDGPFKGTRMAWSFVPLEDGRKTEVTFEADFHLPGTFLNSLSAIVTSIYAREVVDAFIRRAEETTPKKS